MSSTSVETEAACQAALDIVAMRHMLEEIGIWYNEPVVIYEDNQPTIRVANNETSIADAGRHIEVKNFKLGELVEDSTIVLKYIETQRQVADLLTKPWQVEKQAHSTQNRTQNQNLKSIFNHKMSEIRIGLSNK